MQVTFNANLIFDIRINQPFLIFDFNLYLNAEIINPAMVVFSSYFQIVYN